MLVNILTTLYFTLNWHSVGFLHRFWKSTGIWEGCSLTSSAHSFYRFWGLWAPFLQNKTEVPDFASRQPRIRESNWEPPRPFFLGVTDTLGLVRFIPVFLIPNPFCPEGSRQLSTGRPHQAREWLVVLSGRCLGAFKTLEKVWISANVK